MSAEHVGWAFRQDVGSPTRKLVLVALADRCNKDSLQCNPHIETLSADCNLGERATRQALKDLCDLGVISRVRARRRDGSLSGYDYEFPDVRRGAQPAASPTGGEADVAAPDAGSPAARGAGLEGNREVLNREGTSGTENLPAAAPPYDPLRGRKVDSQDLVWNNLAAVTRSGSKIDGSRMRRALDSIRSDLWDWVQERGPQAAAYAISDPDRYEAWAARAVHQVGVALIDEAPTLTWGPEGIARNFRRGIDLVEARVDVDAIVAARRSAA